MSEVNWAQGYSAQYYMSILDKETLRETSLITVNGATRTRVEITGGSITRSLDDLQEAADVDCENFATSTEQFIRLWLDARQNGASSHVALFTGIATSPTKDINGSLISNSLQCYSILKILQDMLLDRGWYCVEGSNSQELIESLLLPLPRVPIISSGMPTLTESIIAEDGENRLSMTYKILNSISNTKKAWRLRLDGEGNVYIEQQPRLYSKRFSAIDNDVIETSLSINYDWYSCPNVYRAIYNDDSFVARDDDPDSIYSTVSRGREVWAEDTDPQLSETETLEIYAKRMLKESQDASMTISYKRRFDPDVRPNDIVRIDYPAQGVSGDFVVTKQDITLGYHAKTSEEVSLV